VTRSRPPHRGQARTSSANTRRIKATRVQACVRPAELDKDVPVGAEAVLCEGEWYMQACGFG